MTRLRVRRLRPLMQLGWMAGALLFLHLPACREADVHAQGAPAREFSYFGQPSPGKTPALFAPARFQDPGEYHSPPVFSPDGREVWWTPMPGHGEPTTLTSRLVDGAWTDQTYVDFGLEGGATEVTFSPDGRRIFFLSRQPVEGEPVSPGLRQNPERIWYADRTADGFGPPRPIGATVFRHPTHWAFSVASSGNLYFTSRAPEGGEGADIYVAPFDGTTWGEPRPLGPGVNSGVAENCPFVAPDESYLLFTRIDEAHYNPDLFISRRRPDGSWGRAEPLPAPINSEATEIYGVVSPDGRYLFFLSWREGAGRPFWVEADFLRTGAQAPRVAMPVTTTAAPAPMAGEIADTAGLQGPAPDLERTSGGPYDAAMDTPRVAIVTAASRGMGAACARDLAARGYRLALLARSDAVFDLARELGARAVQGSVASEEDLRRLATDALDTWGRIDAVVNNTGHVAKGELLELTDAQWQEGLDLLLMNVVRMARIVTPAMIGQGGGALVNISSFSAADPGLRFPISAVLRAALGNFTKLYSQRYAAQGIRMNTVLPGWIDSYPVDSRDRDSIPAQRAGTVDEVARVVSFLLSEDASYVTGESLLVDGGLVRSV